MAPMRMQFDMTESARQIAPEGEYMLRCKSKVVKNSSKGKPMVEVKWEPYNPPAGVSQDQIDKCTLLDWISLAPNALFSLRGLAYAAAQNVDCASCNTSYEANLDFCPACQSALFTIDLDFIDTANVGAFVKITKSQKNDNDVNEISKYFRPGQSS